MFRKRFGLLILFLGLVTAVILPAIVQANALPDSAVIVPEPYRVLQRDPGLFAGPRSLIAHKKGIYFAASSGGEHGLWRSDGTDGGSVLIRSFGPTDDHGDSPFAYTPWAMGGNTLYLLTQNPQRLWHSDGTEAGTVQQSLPPVCAEPYMITAVVGDAYFFSEADGNWLCKASDPAIKIKKIGADSVKDRTTGTLAGETLLFFEQLIEDFSWHVAVSDGTPSGTITQYAPAGRLGTVDGNLLYFSACSGWDADCEPWKLEGLAAAPERVKDIGPGDASSNPSGFSILNNHVYFSTKWYAGGKDRLHLWKSDGTDEGTVLVADVGMCTQYARDPVPSAILKNRLFFPGDGGDGDCELWLTDGTEAGTFRAKDIWPGSSKSSYPENLTTAGDYVYFSAFEKEHGRELWRSDGTEQGTILVKDIVGQEGGGSDLCGYGSCPNSLTVSKGRLFFAAGGDLWAICLKDTPPAADFSAWPTEGPGPLQVTFENYSTCEITMCVWEFGDGDSATGCANQTHTYDKAGTYTVKLSVSGPSGKDDMTLKNHITVVEASTADFSASPLQGTPPLEVAFTNLSAGDFDTCVWDFGDGKTTTTCTDTSHRYRQEGRYTVSLTVSGAGGEDTTTREEYILVESFRVFLPGIVDR